MRNFSSSLLRNRAPRCGWGSCCALGLMLWVLMQTGCGTTKSNTATEQMLNSDAVDAAVAKIDFTPLKGQLVYFDTQYMVNYKGVGFVTSEYVISSMRQQMMAAGVLLQPKLEDADYVVEGRIGTLGTDSHEVVYGIPASSALNAAASAATTLSGVPASPTIPEMSAGRRNAQAGAAKLGVFAYDRESREAVWQAGISVARSTARDVWIFGVGPFQKGSIYNGKTRFAGASHDAPVPGKREGYNGPIAGYREEQLFRAPMRKSGDQLAEEKPSPQDGDAADPKVLPAAGTSEGKPAPAGEQTAESEKPGQVKRTAPPVLQNPLDFSAENRR